jgi:hypothetical protein
MALSAGSTRFLPRAVGCAQLLRQPLEKRLFVTIDEANFRVAIASHMGSTDGFSSGMLVIVGVVGDGLC